MGKFAKVCLATAGIMMGVGVLFCLIGGLFGGGNFIRYARNDAYMGRRIDEAAEAFGQVAESLDDAFSFHLGGHWDDGTKDLEVNGGRKSNTLHEGTVPAQDVRALHLTLGAGKFIIREKDTEGGNIDIRIQGTGACDYYVSGGDGILYVEGFKNINNFKGIGNKNIITMDIPQGLSFEDVEIEVGAGIMEIHRLSAGGLETVVGAGEVLLADITAEEFLAEIGVGLMQTENAHVRDANIQVNMGSCEFTGSISGDLEAECGMGNLGLTLEGRQEDHNYELECSAGNIELDGNSISSFALERNIDNGADSTYGLVCDMGNITVDFKE